MSRARVHFVTHASSTVCKERAYTRRFSTTFFQKGDVGAHNKDEFIGMKVIRGAISIQQRERRAEVRSRASVTRYFRNSHYDDPPAQ